MTTQNPWDLICELLDGGMKSARLEAYLAMRGLVVQKLGDKAAPILNVQQVKEKMFEQFKRELASNYRHSLLHQRIASAFYHIDVNTDTGLTELARLGQADIGNDFGLKDLDILADVITGVTKKDLVINGNLVTWPVRHAFHDFESVVSFITQHGGRI